MPYLSCKKIENDVYNFPTWQYCKYKDIFDSRIIINSTAKFYISISYQKDLLSIDTRIFTPSSAAKFLHSTLECIFGVFPVSILIHVIKLIRQPYQIFFHTLEVSIHQPEHSRIKLSFFFIVQILICAVAQNPEVMQTTVSQLLDRLFPISMICS